MENRMLERIRTYLFEKRARLSEWIHASSLDKKKVLLGPSSQQAVLAHLRGVENAIAETESGTLGVLHDSSSREVVRGIRQNLELFLMGKPLSDDITVVVCRIL